MRNNKVKFLILLTGLGVLLRLFSFFPSVINHDESTYLVIANELLNGGVYFHDVIDLKPPGIFFILALFIKAVGNNIFLIRLLVACMVIATAFLLYLTKQKQTGNEKASRTSAIIYVFISSIFTFYGVSPNTELYFNLFTALALFFIQREKLYWFFIAGLSLGAGFVIKYMIAFDALAFGLFVLIVSYNKKNLSKGIQKIALMLAGFVIPIAVTIIYYAAIGHFKELSYYTLKVFNEYSDSFTLGEFLMFISDFHLRFFPVVVMAVIAMIYHSKNPGNRQQFVFYSMWYGLVLIAILSPRNPFGHYFIQAMVPLSFIAGDFFLKYPDFIVVGRKRTPLVKYIVVVLVLLNMFLQWNDYFRKPDYPKEVANYLQDKMGTEDVLYTGNYHHIIYFLLDKSSPTPYVHRTILNGSHLANVLGLDIDAEYQKIALKEPDFYLTDDEHKVLLQKYFTGNYQLVKEFENGVLVYQQIN